MMELKAKHPTMEMRNPVKRVGIDQVQTDWNQTDETAVDYIKNKPIIPQPEPQIQADWNQEDETALDFIKNKPEISGGDPIHIKCYINANDSDYIYPYPVNEADTRNSILLTIGDYLEQGKSNLVLELATTTSASQVYLLHPVSLVWVSAKRQLKFITFVGTNFNGASLLVGSGVYLSIDKATAGLKYKNSNIADILKQIHILPGQGDSFQLNTYINYYASSKAKQQVGDIAFVGQEFDSVVGITESYLTSKNDVNRIQFGNVYQIGIGNDSYLKAYAFIPEKSAVYIYSIYGNLHPEHAGQFYVEKVDLPTFLSPHLGDWINGLIEAKQVQADWNQTDETALDYIKNKPVEPEITTYDISFMGQMLTMYGKFQFVNTEDSHETIFEKLMNGTAQINRIFDLTYDPINSLPNATVDFPDYELDGVAETSTGYNLFYKRVMSFSPAQYTNPLLDVLTVSYKTETNTFSNIYHNYKPINPSIIIYTDFEFADQPYPHAIKFSNAGGRWGKTNLASVKNVRAGFSSDFNFLLRVTTHGDNVWLRPTETVSANALPRFIGESEKLRKRVVVTFDNWTDDDNPTATMDLQDLVDDTRINSLIDTKLGVVENGTY